jgi:hypothetical protein
VEDQPGELVFHGWEFEGLRERESLGHAAIKSPLGVTPIAVVSIVTIATALLRGRGE